MLMARFEPMQVVQYNLLCRRYHFEMRAVQRVGCAPLRGPTRPLKFERPNQCNGSVKKNLK